MTTKSSIEWNPALTDENESHVILIVTTIMTVLVILSTTTRIGMKLWSRTPLRTEDFLIMVSLALNLTGNVVEFEAVKHGFGRHLQFLSRDQERAVRMWNQLGILFANLAIWSVKISICFFILSLIRDTHRRSRIVTYVLITVTCIVHGCQTIVWAVQARPLEKLWHPEVPGTVASRKTLIDSIIAFTAISSVTDLFYALSPIYFFGGLQMTLKRKLVVISLTGSGLLVFTAAIVRVAFVNDFYNPDITWGLGRVYVCTIIERNLAELIADLPSIFPLLRNMRKKALSIITPSTRHSDNSSSKSTRLGTFTVGSDNRQHKKSRGGEFAAYGQHGLFSTVQDGSEDELPLRGEPRPGAVVPKEDRNIIVQVNIDVDSQERRESASQAGWPVENPRPDLSSGYGGSVHV